MKNINLNKIGVTELKQVEAIQCSGGWIWPVIALLGAMINDAQNNPDDFAKGAAAWGY